MSKSLADRIPGTKLYNSIGRTDEPKRYIPCGHEARIAKYERNELLFDGHHKEALDYYLDRFDNIEQKRVFYIAYNFTQLLSLKMADLLFQEPIEVTTEGSGKRVKPSPDDKFIKNLLTDNDAQITFWESAATNSFFGDDVYKVIKDEDGNVKFFPINPTVWFPVLDKENPREVNHHELVWSRFVNRAGKEPLEYVRKELHYKDRIENKLFVVMKDAHGKNALREVPLATLPDLADVKPTEPNPTGEFLIIPIPNFRVAGRYFGISDYEIIISLIEEINQRFSQVATILTRHAAPHMQVPPGTLDEDGEFVKSYESDSQGDIYEAPQGADGKGGKAVEYITWDGKLDMAYKEIEMLVEQTSFLAELSAALFGKDKGGNVISGRALKYKALSTLSKVARKKKYYDRAIKQIVFVSSLLKGKKIEPGKISIVWGDGLPFDELEAAEAVEAWKRAGAISTRSSVERRIGRDRMEEVEAELEEIAEDSKTGFETEGFDANKIKFPGEGEEEEEEEEKGNK